MSRTRGGQRGGGDREAAEHAEREPGSDSAALKQESVDLGSSDVREGSDPWQGEDPWSTWTPWSEWSQWDDSRGGGDRRYSGWDWSARRPDENAVRVEETTLAVDGRWLGTSSAGGSRRSEAGGHGGERPSEKMTVPTFDGEAGEADLGTSARSYIRKIKVWTRCAKMKTAEQALALYTHLSGKAWLIAEELDVDRLADADGVQYFMDWVRVRFMEVEVTKVGNVMNSLFKKCRRKPDQAVREFNLEFERLLLHLLELGCELPDLVKGWLYLDRLRLTEAEELSLLASVNNRYDMNMLQQAAIIQDRGGTRKWHDHGGRGGGGKWANYRGRTEHTVHMARNEAPAESEEEDDDAVAAMKEQSDAELVSEDIAAEFHGAFMAYQDAKSKYREAMRGRGMDREELRKRSEEKLKAAKARSYCAACKRKGHWHKDPECPLRGKGSASSTTATQGTHMCNSVHMCFMVGGHRGGQEEPEAGGRRILAITDTACSKTVAGHSWYEEYCVVADRWGWSVEIVEEKDNFKFGASRIYTSSFAVWANFAVRGHAFRVKVAVVMCEVPLLFSKNVLARLGMIYNVADDTVDLKALGVEKHRLTKSPTGHPALVVSDYRTADFEGTWAPDPDVQFLLGDDRGAYRERPGEVVGHKQTQKTLFYPKKLPGSVTAMLQHKELRGGSFYLWWSGANQSRDFWCETDDEMIRVHVVPWTGCFDPREWKTSLGTLKGELLESLGDACVVEAVSCLGEGTVTQFHMYNWRDLDETREASKVVGGDGIWVGRSRFTKSNAPPSESSRQVHAASGGTHVAMEDEQGGAAQGLGRPGGGCPSELDRPRIAPDTPRAPGGTQDRGGGGSEGHVQEEPGGAGGDGQEGRHRGPGEDHSRLAAEDPTRQDDEGSEPGGDLREVSGVAVLRGPEVLSGVEHRGGPSQPERVAGARQPGNVGSRAQEQGARRARGDEVAGLPGRPGGEGSGEAPGGVGLGLRGRARGIYGAQSGERQRPGEGLRGQEDAGGGGHRGDGDRHPGGGPGRDLGSPDEAGSSQTEASGEVSGRFATPEETPSVEYQSPAATPSPWEDANGNVVRPKERFNVFGIGERDYELPRGGGGEAEDDYRGEESTEESTEGEGSMSPGVEHLSPRQRAIQGIRKRKLKQTTRKKLVGMAKKLCSVLVACTLAVGSAAHEAVVEPARDLAAVFSSTHGSHTDRGEGDLHADRADLLEVFAGSANMSAAFAGARKKVMRPRDLIFGDNFKDQDCRDQILRDVEECRPRLIWCAPPCTHWCAWSRLNYSREERRKVRLKDKAFLEFIDELFLKQKLLGGHVIVENPTGSDIWEAPVLRRWAADPAAAYFSADMCGYGLRSLDGLDPLKKGMRFLCTDAGFGEVLERQCLRDHVHRQIQGKETGPSGAYPMEFCREVVRALDVVWSRPACEVFVNDAGDPESRGRSGASNISFKGTVPGRVATALRRLHQNLGHPSKRELVRHLRLSGAPEELIRGVEAMQCTVCASNARPKSHHVAKPAVMLDFNECLAMDVVFMLTADQKEHMGLNMVDLASGYQVVAHLPDRKADTVSQVFLQHWVNWAGVPEKLVLDLDTAFQDSFWKITSDHAIALKAAAGQAHWQNGIAERYGSSWKEVWNKLVDAETVNSEEVVDAIAAVNHARNTLRSRSGYSPRQWVFGCQPREVPNLEDGPTGNWSAASGVTADRKMARLHAIRIGAKVAHFQTQSVEAVKKALQHRNRVTNAKFEAGELVYAFREAKGRGKKWASKWLGPAVVIGPEGNNYWVARGGRCLLVAGEHLRPAEHEEVSQTLRLKAALSEAKKVIDEEFAEYVDETAERGVRQAGDLEDMEFEDVGDVVEGDYEMGVEEPPEERKQKAEAIHQKIQQAVRRQKVLDDVPISVRKTILKKGVESAHIAKHGELTGDALEKALDKELPWHMIPAEEREMYKKAELKQWNEHLEFKAVRPLSLEESRRVEAEVDPSRILPSRFLYRDKNRQEENKPRSRVQSEGEAVRGRPVGPRPWRGGHGGGRTDVFEVGPAPWTTGGFEQGLEGGCWGHSMRILEWSGGATQPVLSPAQARPTGARARAARGD